MQQGDILLYQTDDDGEINVENGLVEMAGGLQTAAYLSMFGGSETDIEWWGNIDELLDARKYTSETQILLKSIPSTTGNLNRIKSAVERDLAWMVTDGAATEIAVEVTMPGLNQVLITIDIDGDESLEFLENWNAEI